MACIISELLDMAKNDCIKFPVLRQKWTDSILKCCMWNIFRSIIRKISAEVLYETEDCFGTQNCNRVDIELISVMLMPSYLHLIFS